MYESPIDIIYNDIQYKVVEEFDKNVVSAVQSYGIDVNKEELLKALRYDRQQYEKGYADAKAEQPSAQPEIIRCRDCKYCEHWYADKGRCFLWSEVGIDVFEDGFCNYAEREDNGLV